MIGKVTGHTPVYNLGANAEAFIAWCGNHIRTPEQKVVLGATALATQPFFDLYNKKVDEDTRKVACARTVARLIVGTATGFFIRRKFIQIVENNSEIKSATNKAIKNFFTPSSVKSNSMDYRNYRDSLGTFLAIAAMVITNFAVDAPLTQVLTNFFTRNINKKNAKEVSNDKH